MTIRAVLFDFNGVLLDDEPVHFELFRRVLREEGLDLTEQTYFEEIVALDDRRGFAASFERSGRDLPESLLLRLCARKAAYYVEWMRANPYPFFAGAVDLVRSASNLGLHLGVVSGALRAEIEGALRQEDLLDHLKFLVAAEDVEHSKPDPEGYRRGLELLNSQPPLPERLIHPHEVLAIEDTAEGLRSAREAGLRTIGVAQTLPAEALEADLVVTDVAQLDLAACCEQLTSS